MWALKTSGIILALSPAPLLLRFAHIYCLTLLLLVVNLRKSLDNGQVDDYTADFIIGQLLYLDAEDPKKDIKLFINSPGGSVTAGMPISSLVLLLLSHFPLYMYVGADRGKLLFLSGSIWRIIQLVNLIVSRFMTRNLDHINEGVS